MVSAQRAQLLSDLAKRLNLKAEYEVFYSHFSNVAHSQEITSQMKVKGDLVVFENVRNLEGLDVNLSYTITLSLRTYREILNHYLPDEIENFKQKYNQEWRERYLSIKKIDISDDNIEII